MLFILMTVVASYFGIGVVRHQREQAALPKITAAGGTFAYGRSYFYPFRQIYIVAFEGRQLTDAKLHDVVPQLQDLSGLTFMQFIRTGITDGGLCDVCKLKQLETLHLWDNKITDAGLPQLKQLTSLTELELRGTLLSDKGLANLQAMTGLRKLTLSVNPPPISNLTQMGEDLLAEQPIPGIISNAAVTSLQKSMQHCTVVPDTMGWQFSGEKSN
jgi:Leucine rich repeat